MGNFSSRSWSGSFSVPCLALLLVAAPGLASAQTIEWSDFGVYPHDGAHVQANQADVPLAIYRTGNCLDCVEEWRSFYVFDLSDPGLPASVTEVRLRLDALVYQSPDPTETFVLYAVSTSIDDLVTTGKPVPDNIAIWNDLGSGTIFGSRDFSASDDGSTVEIVLNGDGLAAVNAALAAGESLAIGGAVTTCATCTTPGQGLADEFIFRADTLPAYADATKQLVLVSPVVPVLGPWAAGLLTVALLGSGLAVRRASRR